jgi:hypothetical protein
MGPYGCCPFLVPRASCRSISSTPRTRWPILMPSGFSCEFGPSLLRGSGSHLCTGLAHQASSDASPNSLAAARRPPKGSCWISDGALYRPAAVRYSRRHGAFWDIPQPARDEPTAPGSPSSSFTGATLRRPPPSPSTTPLQGKQAWHKEGFRLASLAVRAENRAGMR